ncbi:hypothetical protein [Helicobacter valdiviensis]|uniref:hypothetical protein n=1 Tax=Helicobacter valdiviensis TaxID=1458358 RepID=UPI0015EB8542|nr:hypothetical protein [Helicobacter valdiviensis]
MLKKWILLATICFNLVSYAYMLDTNAKGDFTLKELSGEELKSALAKANKLKKRR